MSKKARQRQMSFVEDSPVKTCPLPESARDWLESEAGCGLSSIEFLQSLGHNGRSSKMCPAYYRRADVQPVKPLDESLGFTSGYASVREVSNALSALQESECLKVIEDATLPSSFRGWKKSGIARPGERLTFNTTEWPKDAAVCSLSQVLETDVAPKYYLSPKACRGILRRAEKRGKELPEMLRQALDGIANE